MINVVIVAIMVVRILTNRAVLVVLVIGVLQLNIIVLLAESNMNKNMKKMISTGGKAHGE
ncbi:MAG: hypothetical protein DRP02_08820 [Candidatus Gerdarchaeota archaeon]|nr:MAG: hypothetical protein DRP02_08820 [Candidatus Gerdarchaeota archaeon]